MCVMVVRVGVRELQHNASRVIERIKEGQTVEITERGRLVALLIPPGPSQQAREELIATGALHPGRGGLAGWRPLPPRPDVPPLSEVLAEMRGEDDR
ncbi:type II toxin-antitoxin system Phd/YefM family antitoxin [Frankia sp. Cppng1_Ct_nod]|uniref:type II toxin-antitoxin system Phd/YefM family antitoxin n=1 Tax=Frankia sp. Cppng1_Ct_nod TaxID=2897162 RepID=UPI0010419A91|nr:type II toxin-antitoxin system Phd/YefM family antitoxin [Frankia sp. Cppng1_Ct_nod]